MLAEDVQGIETSPATFKNSLTAIPNSAKLLPNKNKRVGTHYTSQISFSDSYAPWFPPIEDKPSQFSIWAPGLKSSYNQPHVQTKRPSSYISAQKWD